MYSLKRLFATAAFFLLVSGCGGIMQSSKDTATITLPENFALRTIAQDLGNNRHIATGHNADVYVKLGRLDKKGHGIVHLKWNKNGKQLQVADAFGDFEGTGIVVKDGFLYASSDENVYRYRLNADGNVMNKDNPEILITGLINRRQHASKSLALDENGNIYVNIGAPSNSCQEADRTPGSKGMMPCPILDSAGGIWQFKADKLNQTYKDGIRYATGLRNVVGMDWDKETNALYAMMHGRDQLNTLFPELFDENKNAELPAEEFFRIRAGGDYGWPYCYYDGLKDKKLLSPEYGGDGEMQGRCANVEQPEVVFPAHWGPNAVLFYTGNHFPEKYKNGAFVAFHGSWNRAPLSQAGYNVCFIPFKDGKPTGEYEIFASGFAGKTEFTNTRDAQYRPCGLAQTPQGTLLVSDSKNGKVWEIYFKPPR